MVTTSKILGEMEKSRKFLEGRSPEDRRCFCEKCNVSLYRHTHEVELADPRHSFWSYLRFCVSSVPNPSGLWMEFGVGGGTTISFIADLIKNTPVFGFDSFLGLPEEWRMSDERIYPKSKYTRDGVPPSLRQDNIRLVSGYFDESLPNFLNINKNTCSFIHIDCDLYSSTIGIFNNLLKERRIVSGTVILFDEFHNYKYFEKDEFQAFKETFTENKIPYRWLAHTESAVDWNGNQAALVVL